VHNFASITSGTLVRKTPGKAVCRAAALQAALIGCTVQIGADTEGAALFTFCEECNEFIEVPRGEHEDVPIALVELTDDMSYVITKVPSELVGFDYAVIAMLLGFKVYHQASGETFTLSIHKQFLREDDSTGYARADIASSCSLNYSEGTADEPSFTILGPKITVQEKAEEVSTDITTAGLLARVLALESEVHSLQHRHYGPIPDGSVDYTMQSAST